LDFDDVHSPRLLARAFSLWISRIFIERGARGTPKIAHRTLLRIADVNTLHVVHLIRHEKVIRIVSARHASQEERALYEQL
jgi:uncharacterized DUF497 family protein